MIPNKVDVLPAPLRPKRVTTSPVFTSKSMPCSTWLSPYHPCNPATRSSGPLFPVLVITRSDIGLDHFGRFGHRLIIALGQNLATCEDRDPVRQVSNDRQIVLDHKDCAVLRHTPDQIR